MPNTLSVLVVDDHPVFADALGARLAAENGIGPVFRAYTAAEALRRLRQAHIDVAVVDYLLATDETGSSLARQMRDEWPGTAVIMLSAVDSVDAVVDALAAGARGWLAKTTNVAHLVNVVRRAHSGEMWLDPAVLGRVLPILLADGDAEVLDALTARELEILHALGDALSRREIATRFGISENTVRTHLQNILAKLGVHSSVEAVSLLLRSRRY